MFARFLIGIAAMMAMQAGMAQDPREMPDSASITISGTVVDTAPEAFALDYGEGIITVEMDDWDWYPDAAPIIDGDEVTVYGFVDDDLYETDTIEASSVYVDNLNTYFYANGIDEEDVSYAVLEPIDIDVTVLDGTVMDIDGREFEVFTGSQSMTVDTSLMSYNPLDNKGLQQIDIGDRVSVTGDMDYDVIDQQELMAESVVTLTENSTVVE